MRGYLRQLLSTALEIAGAVAIVYAAWQVSPTAGVALGGAALVFAGFAVGGER